MYQGLRGEDHQAGWRGEGSNVDCVGSAEVGSKEPRVASNNAGGDLA